MGPGGGVRRRWFGGAVLVTALLMLISGETFLESKLHGLLFVVYWLFCLGLTGLAVLVALVDARASRTEIQREKRALLEQIVRGIQEAAATRKHRRRNRHSNSSPKDLAGSQSDKEAPD